MLILIMKILIICFFAFLLCQCSEDKNNKKKSDYKKQSDLPYTGNKIIKNDSKKGQVSDYY